MYLPRIDVYEFIRIHDKLNIKYDDEINVPFVKNNKFDCLKKDDEAHERTIRLDEIRECDECMEFCNNGLSDIEAIEAIHEAMRVIHEALGDIEKNRICKSISIIIKGIRDTKEGANIIIEILKKNFEPS